jgi:anthranilate synthase
MQRHLTYHTAGGLTVTRRLRHRPGVLEALPDRLDRRRGAIFSCGVEAPGRYARHGLGFIDPPMSLTARGPWLEAAALNARGRVVLAALAAAFPEATRSPDRLRLALPRVAHAGPEEDRTRAPSVMSLLRRVRAVFAAPEDELLGLYGCFGYDLAFALEAVPLAKPRPADQRDLVLYLPDRLWLAGGAEVSYDFAFAGTATHGRRRSGAAVPLPPAAAPELASDHGQGEYAAKVAKARRLFARGDLFELVLSQTLRRPAADPPSVLFGRLRTANPAPYEALVNLGEGEALVIASPEMFVRVSGRRVETCPISGTVARGRDAVEDAEQIRVLLNSAKDHAELTMCTDVDRNDKARVCEAGSVRVVGRRLVEMYSRLIHTVDHVEGRLRPGMDALDAFLTHAWAVTVTGAPKLHAMRRIEAEEPTPRRWYGGAFGALRFDGSLDTGLTLRALRLAGGVAEVRVGATLLHDSDPEAEHRECLLKASALLEALSPAAAAPPPPTVRPGSGKRVLLVDHEDSFVLMLASCLRATGAEVVTLRPEPARRALATEPWSLVVLSPGPGRPADFGLSATLDLVAARRLPAFGVCLGLQGMIEHGGGSLAQLPEPVHGKASALRHDGRGLFAGLPDRLTVGRYHSLVAAAVPADYRVTARTDDGVVMAIAHRHRPWTAVQFHPESLLSGAAGQGLLAALIRSLPEAPGSSRVASGHGAMI